MSVLTEPSPLPCPSALCAVHDSWTRRWRAVSPGAEGVRTRLCLWGHRLSPVPVGSPSAGGGARCDVGAAATPRWRRRGVQGAQRPCTRLWTTLSSARHVPPPTSSREAGAATASGAGRRLLPTTKTSAPPRRRRLLPPCGFSHRGAMALLWRTRDGTSTAARLRRRLLA